MTDAIIEAAARALRKADLFNIHTVQDDQWLADQTGAHIRSEIAEVVLAAVTPLIRAAALEEAAQVAEDYELRSNEAWMATDDIAAAIRALKEQP